MPVVAIMSNPTASKRRSGPESVEVLHTHVLSRGIEPWECRPAIAARPVGFLFATAVVEARGIGRVRKGAAYEGNAAGTC